MNEFPFQIFINLVLFDRQIATLEETIEQKDQILEQVRAKLHEHEQLFTKLKMVEHDAQKAVDNYELDAKTLDVRMAKIKYNLDNVANPKEYASLSKELAKAQEEQQTLEADLLDAWRYLENCKRDAQHVQATHHEQQEQYTQEISALEQEITALDEQMAQLLEQRAGKMQGIPDEWLQKYAMMRHRVANPVVPVSAKSCSGCAYTLSDQDLLRLSRRALLQCKHCFRFLYDPTVIESVGL